MYVHAQKMKTNTEFEIYPGSSQFQNNKTKIRIFLKISNKPSNVNIDVNT